MQTLFSRAGIPVYCASSAPVAQNPLIAALLSAMQAVLRYEPGPVLAFLKSEFSPLCEADCDTLEHYAYYWGIRGSAWEKPWQLHPCGLVSPWEPEDEAALQALNALREQAVAPLRTLRLALAKARTVDEQVRAIAALLETLDAAGRLQTQQDALEQAGQASARRNAASSTRRSFPRLSRWIRFWARQALKRNCLCSCFHAAAKYFGRFHSLRLRCRPAYDAAHAPPPPHPRSAGARRE